MRIRPIVYAVLVLVIFLGVVYAFQSTGFWSVSGRVDSHGRTIQPVSSDVASIKGWMTLEQICNTYPVSLEEIIAAFNLPTDTTLDTQVRELESDTFSMDDLRRWLQSKIDSETSDSLLTITPTSLLTPTPQTTSSELETHEDMKVSGNTTFQDLLDWGINQSTIETIINLPLPADTSVLIRDYIRGSGVGFSLIKDELQVEVDKLK